MLSTNYRAAEAEDTGKQITVILEIFIQDFLVFLISMIFNFSFLYRTKCKQCIFKFLILVFWIATKIT